MVGDVERELERVTEGEGVTVEQLVAWDEVVGPVGGGEGEKEYVGVEEEQGEREKLWEVVGERVDDWDEENVGDSVGLTEGV